LFPPPLPAPNGVAAASITAQAADDATVSSSSLYYSQLDFLVVVVLVELITTHWESDATLT
jgi:hypothetical protein